MSEWSIEDALRQLIRGKRVRRASHDLVYDGEDATSQFLKVLAAEGYQETEINSIDIKPGERVPAFYIKDARAHFGWVFWEIFFPGRMRKIFGSVHKNQKGDWAIILGKGSREPLYTNLALKEHMDPERPSEF